MQICPRNTETERSNVNHIVDMINIDLMFALSMNMIGSCLLQYGYSCKLENNCCSVYMNKTFYGHTLNINGLLIWIT